MAEQMWIRGENGALQVFSVPIPSGIQHRLDRGDLVRVAEDGTPWVEVTEGPEPADTPPPDAPELPKRTASRAVWERFALSQGMDTDQAAGMTRDDLVEEFTKERGGS
jgi:hypothetical protein